MKQEDYNSVMKSGMEIINSSRKRENTKTCPVCDQPYLGNGVDPCVECEEEDA